MGKPPLTAAARRRRRQRHRNELMSGFAVLTLLVLVGMALTIARLGKLPTTTSLSAATSNRPQAALTDTAAGLSYALLPAPWQNGCPMRDNPIRWTTGEGAAAGHVASGGQNASPGPSTTWYANACSGLLPSWLQSASLSHTAKRAAAAIDTDQALPHHRTVTSSAALRVGGHRAWMVKFTVRFPGQHLAWTSELGAVVVIDEGAGKSPAVFYVEVPDNLDATATIRTLISSLRGR